VWNLVERASQATDAEAFVRQSKPEPTELRGLLAEQVALHERSQSGARFDLQCPQELYVDVDATLLKEAVSNLLANAASFAEEGSTIKVAATQNGVRVAIDVINSGPTIQRDPEELFGPFASTRTGPSSEHQGLGLYLVRMIAEQHGGAASIANLSDRSGVIASIILPLVRDRDHAY
jgi:signal transduction histidine kinase